MNKKRSRDVELGLVAELMKNSRRSDRELAKAVGVSQPTVSRMIKKLEREGYIKEYTAIPDFSKLGFHIMSVTFTKLRESISTEDFEKRRTLVREAQKMNPDAYILAMGGMGLDSDRMIITYHEDYSSYADFMEKIKGHPLVRVQGVKSFIVNLDASHYCDLTLSEVANHLPKAKKKKQTGA